MRMLHFNVSNFGVARFSIRSLCLTLSLATLGLCVRAGAQAIEGPPPTQDVALEVFKGPRSHKLQPPAYPVGERVGANEGWVNLSFMIDPAGKPYEISIADSTGIPAFERAAIRAAERWTFEPATLNGVPIDAGHTMKITFRMTNPDTGASSDFVKAYRRAINAMGEKDKAAADAAFGELKVTNLYEDAFFNVARYTYHQQWGDKTQQIAALERAIAHEGSAKFLPKSSFQTALLSMMQLKYETHDFADVLSLWRHAQKSGIDEARLAPWRPVVEDLEKLRTDNRSYPVAGAFGDAGSWSYTLHKKKFRFEVASGRISEVKLRCEKKYVFFRFDPELQYAINEKFGSCGMELIGDPATQFTLIQS
jgi:TonB family protein